jgi:hypothetical protein
MTLQEKAEDLDISTHTLKNWQKRNKGISIDPGDLVRRANKLNSSELCLPTELLALKENRPALLEIREILLAQSLSPEGSILLFSLYYLQFLRLLNFTRKPGFSDSLSTRVHLIETSSSMEKELKMRLSLLSDTERISPLCVGSDIEKQLSKRIKKEPDLPGLLYQSLRKEGFRSRQGAWFTPVHIIDSMIRPYVRKKETLLDPCCGSGLFLCRFAEMKGSADHVRGIDRDPFSVFLTRLNLFCRFPDWEDFHKIQEGDSLKISTWGLSPHDFIATNPPWGAHMDRLKKKEMQCLYPEIVSGETASLFLFRTIMELPEGGVASLLLPESLFYVQAHQDIRTCLLNMAPPVKIMDRGRLFKGVYTSALSCDFIKKGNHKKVTVLRDGESQEKQNIQRYKKNQGQCINFHCPERSHQIIMKIKGERTQELSSQCRWLLGVVSGDNKRFVVNSPVKGTIPLLTGKDLMPFWHKPVCSYLKIDDGPLQQNLPLEMYNEAKLIYRFIGYKPVFSLDRTGLVTLNSANALIPPQEIALEELAFWYNSSLFRYIWLNQFRSVKMLRYHLEELPIPLWNDLEKKEVLHLVNMAENRQDVRSAMDEMIYKHFNLTEEEISIVCSQI